MNQCILVCLISIHEITIKLHVYIYIYIYMYISNTLYVRLLTDPLNSYKELFLQF